MSWTSTHLLKTLLYRLFKTSWREARLRRVVRNILLFLAVWTATAVLAEQFYAVRKLDTLTSIARDHGTSVTALSRANKLKNRNSLQVGQRLVIPGAAQANKIHVVKKGDVLGDIARKYKVSINEIVAVNNLPSADDLSIGDEIKIPRQSSGSVSGTSLASSLRSELNRIRVVRPQRWQHIVIHHSGASNGTVKGMDRYHRIERGMENGIAYHFVIGNGRGIPDGKIEITHRWRGQLNGGHVASSRLNSTSVGICLVGNFERSKPTRKQIESLQSLCTYLTRKCSLSGSRIQTHRQINPSPTKCPGRHFPIDRFKADFRS